jgi:hypothetical protein
LAPSHPCSVAVPVLHSLSLIAWSTACTLMHRWISRSI